MEMRISPRKNYLDVLRVLASFLVCYNHSFGYHIFLDQEADGSILSWLNVFLSAVTTMDIPLFFMISGALLLGKQESYETVWKNRIARILVLIFCASGVTYLILGARPLSAKEFFQKMMTGTVDVAHWYLYAYLGYLVTLPILRKIARQLTFRDVIALTVLRTLMGPVLMSVNFWLSHWGLDPFPVAETFYVPFIGQDSFFCTLMGYYFACQMDVERMGKKQVLCCVALFFGANAFSSAMTYAEGAGTGFTQTYIGMCRYLSAMAVFPLARYLFAKIRMNEKLQTVLKQISSAGIGIYLLEPMVVHYLSEPFFRNVPWRPTVITAMSVLWSIVCVLVGTGVTYLLRKIPGVKKFL